MGRNIRLGRRNHDALSHRLGASLTTSDGSEALRSSTRPNVCFISSLAGPRKITERQEAHEQSRFFPRTTSPPLDDVLKFAYMAMKEIPRQKSEGLWVRLHHFLAESYYPIFYDESLDERHNALDTVPERWQYSYYAIESRVQIISKSLSRYFLLEVSTQRGNHTQFSQDVFGSFHTTERAILQNPQPYPLHR
jgi:hypothetical protein